MEADLENMIDMRSLFMIAEIITIQLMVENILYPYDVQVVVVYNSKWR